MKIDQERCEGATTLVPHDSLVGEDSLQLGGVLASVMDENPHSLSIDMSNVAQIDSKGLEVLASTTEQLIRGGRALKLVAANETIREILELTELASLFEYSDNVDCILESI